MSAEAIKDFYNSIEPFIWYGIGVLLIPALRRHAPLRLRLALGGLLGIFGTSDFYETEAWWTPWWLLLWKASCLALIAVLAWRLRRRYQARAEKRAGTPAPLD